MQALSREDNMIDIKFDAIEELNNSIRKLIKDKADEKISFVDFTPEPFKEIKDSNQLFEKNVNILKTSSAVIESSIRKIPTICLSQICHKKF